MTMWVTASVRGSGPTRHEFWSDSCCPPSGVTLSCRLTHGNTTNKENKNLNFEFQDINICRYNEFITLTIDLDAFNVLKFNIQTILAFICCISMKLADKKVLRHLEGSSCRSKIRV